MEKKYNQFRGALPVLIPVAAVALLAVTGLGFLLFGRDSSPAPKGVSTQLAQTWKSTPSDIAGMSKWDKYEAGLAVAAGSDTDSDGLTDREELEIYHTDPLKASTAGDLYTDGYKVSNGMKPNKKYDYQGRQVFPYNNCAEVSLSAQEPLDFNAVVTPCEGITQYMGLKVYAAYRVYNYAGKFSVDLSDVLRREGIKISDIDIYVSDGNDFERYGHTKKDNVLTLKENFSADCTYTVYCTEDNFLRAAVAKLLPADLGGSITSALGDLSDALTPEDEEETEETVTGSGVVLMSPFLNLLLKVPIVVVSEDLGDDVKNEQLDTAISLHAADLLISEDNVSDFVFKYDHKNAFVVQAFYEFFRENLGFFDFTYVKTTGYTLDDFSNGNGFPWHYYLFLFYSYEGRKQYDAGLVDPDNMETPENQENPGGVFQPQEDSDRPESDTASGFHPQWDTLPFGNFKTTFSPDGSCAGIAHLTTYLYNNDTFPARSTAAPWDSEVAWDLTKDTENSTLCDPGLRNYKDANFITDRADSDGMIDMENVSAGEVEFFKMIADTYLAANENAEFICKDLIGGDFSRVQQSYAVIASAMDYLDSGKILTVYMDMVDGSRHAVNIYDYKVSEENPDIVTFAVYDCNYPDNQTGTDGLSETGFNLIVEKKVNKAGTEYTFGYDYFPTNESDYGATSNTKRTNGTLFLILDEQGHLLND